jgi:hypothetical protein
MKTFNVFYSNLIEKVNLSNVVVKKKVGKHLLQVTKDGNKFVAYINGEVLDRYNNRAQAEKMGSQFAKELA